MNIVFNKNHSLVDSLPKGTTVETVVCLSREKADDYVRISVHTKDLQIKSNRPANLNFTKEEE